MPRPVLIRETALALLPALLTLGLLLMATQPAYRTLIENERDWSPYEYRALAQDLQTYQIARLDPTVSVDERQRSWLRALSSTGTPGQFTDLGSVESFGEARLESINRDLQLNTDLSIRRAIMTALRLNAQADTYATKISEKAIDALQRLRFALILAAGLTGLMSLLLITRALLMWRAERERRSRREARQREALSLASHELRRPLQSLLLASDLLRHAQSAEQRQHLLSLIEDSVVQLDSRADLTRLNDLYLDVILRVQRTDLRLLVQRLAARRVDVCVPETPLIWPVDANRVRQVLENLVENALKYTTGLVEVQLRLVGNRPEITVRDYGPGIPPALIERVFLPYERGPQGLDDGHGLGLALVRRYARAHGGDVCLSHAPDGGLIATVRLGEPSTLLSELSRPERAGAAAGS
ncbi:putative histidine kinase, classic; putative membrane protein [Deinococcus deserti VCD115]|uniref:histidine kinase n=1 Tax=Deinococcus deserti (strain DSM 17065 / CIP 109153 / LMG 22923 / VCD115) TaxID=546414 RepID=C1CZW8_DEIDV|nr:putative histidine kinase, classic; putative membrane protein [Deinococcus deserti VCD115]